MSAVQAYGKMPPGLQTFVDANGVPLSGGLVYVYVPGTTTPAETWQDANQLVPNANPIVLNAAGQCSIWAPDGQYRQILQDEFENVIWDQITQVGTNEQEQSTTAQVMEVQVPSGSGPALTTQTAADITNMTLPAGIWLVSGNVGNNPTDGLIRLRGWLSLVSATLPSGNPVGYFDTGAPDAGRPPGASVPTLVTGTAAILMATGAIILQLTKATVVYLSTWAEFDFGAANAFGGISAVLIAPGPALLNGNTLPTSNPGVGSGKLWNNNGFVVVA